MVGKIEFEYRDETWEEERYQLGRELSTIWKACIQPS